jgi:hypothetical protein
MMENATKQAKKSKMRLWWVDRCPFGDSISGFALGLCCPTYRIVGVHY